MSEQIYFILKCIKAKKNRFPGSECHYCFIVGPFLTWQFVGRKIKTGNVLSWGFHPSDSVVSGLILQECIQANTHHYN